MAGLVTRLLALFAATIAATAIGGFVAAITLKQGAVPSGDAESDEVSLVGIFEELQFRSAAASFRGGSVTCVYGGGVIDLRGATLDPAGARLDVKAILGGAQLIVPETWAVSTSVIPIFGGVGDGRPKVARPADAPHLTIEGLCLFGGFAIMSEAPASLVERIAAKQEPASA